MIEGVHGDLRGLLQIGEQGQLQVHTTATVLPAHALCEQRTATLAVADVSGIIIRSLKRPGLWLSLNAGAAGSHAGLVQP